MRNSSFQNYIRKLKIVCCNLSLLYYGVVHLLHEGKLKQCSPTEPYAGGVHVSSTQSLLVGMPAGKIEAFLHMLAEGRMPTRPGNFCIGVGEKVGNGGRQIGSRKRQMTFKKMQ